MKKKFLIFFSAIIVCNSIYASPGVPDVPEFDVPSEDEAREASEEGWSSSSPLDLSKEHEYATGSYGVPDYGEFGVSLGGTGVSFEGDLKSLRNLLREGESAGGGLLKQFESASKSADRVINSLGEQFTPDKLLNVFFSRSRQ